MYSDTNIKTISPSHWLNAGYYLISIIGTFIHPLCILLLIVKYLEINCWSYQFNQRTIVEKKGIFSITYREIHYYRIKSIKVDQPLWMRPFNLYNVSLITSDQFQPEIILTAVPDGLNIRNELRNFTDDWRKKEGVKELDLYHMNKY